MSRFSSYTQKDTRWETDGDPSFRGVNMLLERSLLPAGTLARSENKRLRDGVAATRPGTTFPADFNPGFANTIIGSHIYSNPNGDEVMLVATANATYVWALQFGKDAKQIQLDVGQNTGAGFVHFVQAFDKILLLRYPVGGQPVLVWDGVNANKFVPITLAPGGLKLIPPTIDGVPFQNRVILYNPYYALAPFRDQIIVSDPLDYTSYDEVMGVYRINAGESDMVASVLPFYKGSVLVFMTHSVHMLESFTVDPLKASQRQIHNRIGSVGYRMPILIGADAIFLSRPGGFYRVSQLFEDQYTTPPVPISRPIQPLIDRINWDRAVVYGCSAQVGDYTYFAVPLDQKSGASDAVLVLNNVSNEWESAPDWWEDANFRINRLHVTLYDGGIRLFGLDYAAQRVYVLYDGLEDETSGDTLPVHDIIETRGYTGTDPGSFKRFQRVLVGLRSFDLQTEVTALSDGVNEEKTVAVIEKDRLKFYVHGHADFDPASGDPDEPKREDYSTGGHDFAIEDFEGLPDGPLPAIPPTSAVFSGQKQQSLERFQIRQNGRWCSIRVENRRGNCDVLGVGVDSIPAQEGIKVLA